MWLRLWYPQQFPEQWLHHINSVDDLVVHAGYSKKQIDSPHFSLTPKLIDSYADGIINLDFGSENAKNAKMVSKAVVMKGISMFDSRDTFKNALSSYLTEKGVNSFDLRLEAFVVTDTSYLDGEFFEMTCNQLKVLLPEDSVITLAKKAHDFGYTESNTGEKLDSFVSYYNNSCIITQKELTLDKVKLFKFGKKNKDLNTYLTEKQSKYSKPPYDTIIKQDDKARIQFDLMRKKNKSRGQDLVKTLEENIKDGAFKYKGTLDNPKDFVAYVSGLEREILRLRSLASEGIVKSIASTTLNGKNEKDNIPLIDMYKK